MSLWQRAILYLIRKKRRSIIFILTMFVMSSFVLIGLTLKSSAEHEAENLCKSLGSSFTLKLDKKNLQRHETVVSDGISYDMYPGPPITLDIVDKIANLETVSHYVTSIQTIGWVNLDLEPGLFADCDKTYEEYSEDQGYHISREDIRVFMHESSILPNINGELHEHFRLGALKVTEGRNIQKDDIHTAVISEELAQRNHLQLGDTFVIETKEASYKLTDQPEKIIGKPIEVEIVGLFTPLFEQKVTYLTMESTIVNNLIFTDMSTNADINENLGISPDCAQGDVTFFIDDPKNLDSTIEQVRALDGVDISDYILEADDSAYSASMKPLNLISSLAITLLTAGIIGCILILHLVIKIWTRERKQEIAILLSVGEKRLRILLQLVIEGVILTCVALILTFLLSCAMVRGSSRLAEELTKPPADEQAYSAKEEYASLAPNIEKISADAVHLELSLTPSLTLCIAGVAVFVTIFSILSASINTVISSPKLLLSSYDRT